MPERPAQPLVVDVDGALVSGDLLVEGAARVLAASPFSLLVLPLWLSGGRAALKRRIARAVPLPRETLALNPAVLNEIAAARAAGREVWLASAADELAVAPLAESVGATGLSCVRRMPRISRGGRKPPLWSSGSARADSIISATNGATSKSGNMRGALSGSACLPVSPERCDGLDSDARFLPGPRLRLGDCLRALRAAPMGQKPARVRPPHRGA